MKIFIDNGHGIDTPGKRSPDGRFLEYKFNREIAARIASDLQGRGLDAELLVPEIEDISLAERCRRVNVYCQVFGKNSAILISVHANAAGSDGKWHNASGWSAYTTPGITSADILAFNLYEAAKKNLAGHKIRLFNGLKEPDFEENLYILKHSMCPAVLTENFFQDNRKEVEYIQSEAGTLSIVNVHVEGVVTYLRTIL